MREQYCRAYRRSRGHGATPTERAQLWVSYDGCGLCHRNYRRAVHVVHDAAEGEKDMVVVGEASNGREAIEVFRSKRPDVTLMDLQMPGLNGIDAIATTKQEHPQARIIVLTTYEGDVLARRALKAGATGHILKDMIRTELLEAIRAVHLGRKYIPQKIATELLEHYAEDDLSEREIEVLREVARGTSNRIIASHLSISEATVKAHMKNILLKLGASDRPHAVNIATTRGFLM